jgi:hypothetical protein
LDQVVIHYLIERVRIKLGLGSAFGMGYARARYHYTSAVQLVAIRSLRLKTMLAGPCHQRGMRTIYRLCVRANRQNAECKETDESSIHVVSCGKNHQLRKVAYALALEPARCTALQWGPSFFVK